MEIFSLVTFSDEFSEDALEKHDREIQRLDDFYRQNRKVFDRVHDTLRLWSKFVEFEVCVLLLSHPGFCLSVCLCQNEAIWKSLYVAINFMLNIWPVWFLIIIIIIIIFVFQISGCQIAPWFTMCALSPP